MNTNDTRFDRLVDDELSEEERRELLGRLDDEPGGWRRCALAFLEVQCWKQAIRQTPQRARGQVCKPTTQAAKNPQRSPWTGRAGVCSRPWRPAFSWHWGWARWRTAHGSDVRHPGHDGPNRQQRQRCHLRSIAGSAGKPPGSMPPKTTVTPNPWHMVTVSAPSDGRSASFGQRARDRARQRLTSSGCGVCRRRFLTTSCGRVARTGHQVQQRRELVPVPLKDGRQLVVPVDHVDVHYIGNGPY